MGKQMKGVLAELLTILPPNMPAYVVTDICIAWADKTNWEWSRNWHEFDMDQKLQYFLEWYKEEYSHQDKIEADDEQVHATAEHEQ